jgi:hypothetical protein
MDTVATSSYLPPLAEPWRTLPDMVAERQLGI